jgi:hypothetical protein
LTPYVAWCLALLAPILAPRSSLATLMFECSRTLRVWLVADQGCSQPAAELWYGCDTALAGRLAYPDVRAALG